MTFMELLNTNIRDLFKRKVIPTQPKERTTVELLSDIIRLLAPPPRLQDIPDINVYEFRDRVDLVVHSGRAKNYVRRHPLPFIKEIDFGETGGSYTLPDRKLYNKFYERNALQKYVEDFLKPFYKELVQSEKHFTKILNDYNYGMLTSFNMLKDSMEENDGTPTDEVVALFKDIMDRFSLSIEERAEQIEAHRKMLKDATNKSHVEQMKLELEHIDKFIRGDGFDVG